MDKYDIRNAYIRMDKILNDKNIKLSLSNTVPNNLYLSNINLQPLDMFNT